MSSAPDRNVKFAIFLRSCYISLLWSCRHGQSCSWQLNLEHTFFFFLITHIFLFFLSFRGKVWHLCLPWAFICPCNSHSIAAAQGEKPWYAVKSLSSKAKGFLNVILTRLSVSLVSQDSAPCALCFSFCSFRIFPLTPAGEIENDLWWGKKEYKSQALWDSLCNDFQ